MPARLLWTRPSIRQDDGCRRSGGRQHSHLTLRTGKPVAKLQLAGVPAERVQFSHTAGGCSALQGGGCRLSTGEGTWQPTTFGKADNLLRQRSAQATSCGDGRLPTAPAIVAERYRSLRRAKGARHAAGHSCRSAATGWCGAAGIEAAPELRTGSGESSTRIRTAYGQSGARWHAPAAGDAVGYARARTSAQHRGSAEWTPGAILGLAFSPNGKSGHRE
jgi:hypothetical protein